MVSGFFGKIFSPLDRIIKDSRSIGIILALCTVVSIFLANTSFSAKYLAVWNYEFHLPSWLHMPHSILHFINDGFMAVFFFLVGLEIKRELREGELAELKKAIVPVFAAVGGMVVPAAIYVLFNKTGQYQHGWGIPMATDIAFSLGIASLLGKKVPVNLKIFLTALAIIDDLGAIIVIAIFYGSSLNIAYLLTALAITIVLMLMNKFNIKFGWWNFIIGALLWYCVLNSGVHATIAGVIFAFCIPIGKVKNIEHALHTPVNFLVLPIFALANTALVLPADITGAINNSLNWGIIAGLAVGKPLGIVSFCYVLTQLKWGSLPEGTNWGQLTGMGMLAGIGFTMSIFIAMLAFDDPITQDYAKIGILIASVVSAVTGAVLLARFSKTLTKSQ